MTLPPPFDSTRAETRQNRLAQQLTQALAHGGLQVVYQPEVDIQSRHITSLEALCRWQDPELGTVAPDEFIAVAEARGHITALGQYMWQRVLADLPSLLARWPKVRVAVNVSGIELSRPEFAASLSERIRASGSALAQHLELEVTESVFHHDVPTVRQHLQALRALGLTVAIDDFGTGQSSLSRLHLLPFDKIKMDRSFVQALASPMSQAIVEAMVHLTNRFDKTLVVEGVETAQQLQELAKLGCTTVQGYALGAPAPLLQLLAQPDPS